MTASKNFETGETWSHPTKSQIVVLKGNRLANGDYGPWVKWSSPGLYGPEAQALDVETINTSLWLEFAEMLDTLGYTKDEQESRP